MHAEFDQALGRAARHAAELESLVATFASLLISPDAQIGAIVTRRVTFDRARELIQELAEWRIEPEGEALLREVLQQAKDAMEKRNALLHVYWSTAVDDPGLRFPIGHPLRGPSPLEGYTAEQILEIADEIKAAVDAWYKMLLVVQHRPWKASGFIIGRGRRRRSRI